MINELNIICTYTNKKYKNISCQDNKISYKNEKVEQIIYINFINISSYTNTILLIKDYELY